MSWIFRIFSIIINGHSVVIILVCVGACTHHADLIKKPKTTFKHLKFLRVEKTDFPGGAAD
jgi:hypothetical protein